ncbi:phosphorylase superfamily protein [Colletotrichum incanum]|uniref:Phosphorylase superfamily protein n=1 Tax=Colletotrichum incanum TaxID=1573173 RepID=A0A166QUX3_COLIC|nr:phosphorylase superfamily protein [Colletotrichum incanum]
MENDDLPPLAHVCATQHKSEQQHNRIHFDENNDRDGRRSALKQYNNHMLWRIRVYYVVLVLLPNIGKVNVANEIVRLRSIYSGLELALLTGICSGVPSLGTDYKMMLRDVIISKSIVQYDLGQQYLGEFS